MATHSGDSTVALVGGEAWTEAVRDVLEGDFELCELTPEEILEDDEAGDCLVCDAVSSPGRGVSFLERVDDARPVLPVVFVPREGDDRLAAAAVAAGADRYVPFEDLESMLARRVEGALEDGKRRCERALTALQGTARDLHTAETNGEIADRVVTDAAAVLDLPAAAVYLFNPERNALRPAAFTGPIAGSSGRPEPRYPGDGSVIATAFVDNDARRFDDLGRWDAAVSGVRSAVISPLGDHGVFLVGSDQPGAIDDVTSEAVDLLAATAEAALDRIDRESTLRDRDRTLEARDRELSELTRVNEIIREIGADLVRADTRGEIEAAVCQRLTGPDRFAFAWIGERTVGEDRVRPREWAGEGGGYLDALEADVDAEERDPGKQTVATGDPTAVENVAQGLRDAPWRSAAITRGFQSVVSVPLASDEVSYGALAVYDDQPTAFDGTTRSVLRELGETVASAIGSVERKNALLGGRVVELTYEARTADTALARLARETGCRIALEGGLQRVEAGVLAFATVSGGDPETVLERAASFVAVEDATLVGESEEGGLIRLILTSPFLAARLVDHGAVVRDLTAEPDRLEITVAVPTAVETGGVDDLVRTTYPDATLLSRRERGGTPTTPDRLADDVLASLTDRQLEVVRTAYHAGFFESPREHTGQEVARSLDISPTAFSDHTRTVQRKLFATLFEDGTSLGVEH
ncbi:bacterio-opsin activator domain-containing protein [Natrialbaceae archaeon A-gly3]